MSRPAAAEAPPVVPAGPPPPIEQALETPAPALPQTPLGRRRRALLLLLLPAVFLGAFFAYPLARVLSATTADAWRWVAADYAMGRLRIAAWQGSLSAALALAAAWPLAWLHHARRIPGGRLLLALHALPFVMPVFVVVLALQGTVGTRGVLPEGRDLFTLLGPLGAVALANAYYNYGLAARLLHATFDRRPRQLEEAAMTLGASPRAAFWRVSVPLLLPGVAAVALLVFLFCFASFGVVHLLGQGEVATLETTLHRELQGLFPDHDRAAALGILQVALNVTLLAVAVVLLRREERLPRSRVLRRRAGPGASATAWLLAAAAVAPLALVLARGFRLGGEWSLEPWRAILATTGAGATFDFGHALSLSIGYALASTVAAVVLTACLAYGARRLGGRWRQAAHALAALPLGTSSFLVGVGLLTAFGAGDAVDLRSTRTAIVLAHTLVAFPFVARILLPALDQHDRRLDESAALLGAAPLQVVRRVHLPLLAAPLLAATGFAVALSLADYGASLLLMRPENMGLSLWIGSFAQSFSPLDRAVAHALAGAVAALGAASYLAADRWGVRP